MQSIRSSVLCSFLTLVAAGVALPVRADEACLDFKWDVKKERTLFAGTPVLLSAGKDAMSAPSVVPDRLYKLRFTPQDQVAFAISPAKKMAGATVLGGLASLKLSAPGSYRIAVDLPVWVDVVSQHALLPAKDYQGQHECSAPHKIVEFELTGVEPYLLQFSGAAHDDLLVTITASPPRQL